MDAAPAHKVGAVFKNNVMVLEIEKKVTETFEVKTPSYYEYNDDYYYIGEDNILLVRSRQITNWEKNCAYYAQYAAEAIKGREITREEFEHKYHEVVTSFEMILHGKEEVA